MTPEEFKRRWEADALAASPEPEIMRLVRVREQTMNKVLLGEPARSFLVNAGLPEAAPGGFDFSDLGKGPRRIWEIYSPGQWEPGQMDLYASYWMLGTDEDDNPLCLDERDGSIVLVEHEVLFDRNWKGIRGRLVNSGIEQFAECLLIAATLPKEEWESAARRVDPRAMETNGFWRCEPAVTRPWWKFW